jgi:hypothetical protein
MVTPSACANFSSVATASTGLTPRSISLTYGCDWPMAIPS